jgi:hypothetical protein
MGQTVERISEEWTRDERMNVVEAWVDFQKQVMLSHQISTSDAWKLILESQTAMQFLFHMPAMFLNMNRGMVLGRLKEFS